MFIFYKVKQNNELNLNDYKLKLNGDICLLYTLKKHEKNTDMGKPQSQQQYQDVQPSMDVVDYILVNVMEDVEEWIFWMELKAFYA